MILYPLDTDRESYSVIQEIRGLCIVIYHKIMMPILYSSPFFLYWESNFYLTQKHYFDLTIGFFFPLFFQLINILNFVIKKFGKFFSQKYLRFLGGLLINYGLGDDLLLFWYGVFLLLKLGELIFYLGFSSGSFIDYGQR